MKEKIKTYVKLIFLADTISGDEKIKEFELAIEHIVFYLELVLKFRH